MLTMQRGTKNYVPMLRATRATRATYAIKNGTSTVRVALRPHTWHSVMNTPWRYAIASSDFNGMCYGGSEKEFYPNWRFIRTFEGGSRRLLSRFLFRPVHNNRNWLETRHGMRFTMGFCTEISPLRRGVTPLTCRNKVCETMTVRP